ncbi:retrovirus-related pol polyprotein from transposon TNT 1-94 [Tanacetum coccineum]
MLMPLTLDTKSRALLFETQLKTEMFADLKYVQSLKKEVDELQTDKNKFSKEYNLLLQECVSKDNMCYILRSFKSHDEKTESQCLYLVKIKECECLAIELSKRTKNVSKQDYNKLSKSFSNLGQHLISLELALQQYLKAQLQDKNISISELKKLIENMKGKSMDTKFSPTTNVNKNLSKTVTPQILPPNEKQDVRNMNVIKPGMYRIDTRTTQTRVPQLNQTFRNTNPLISTSTGVSHSTSFRRPQLRSTQLKEKVVSYNSQVKLKKTEVEDHHRISSFSNKTKSITACNDNLKSRTSNVNVVCATCGKCVLNSNHDACIYKFINDVNARTKMPKVIVQLIFFIVDSGCTKHMTGNLKLLCNFVEKYLGTIRSGGCIPKIYMLYERSLRKRPTYGASPTQSWLWHHRLSHLNFDAINLLYKKDIVNGLPKLKYVKDQLCSSYKLANVQPTTKLITLTTTVNVEENNSDQAADAQFEPYEFINPFCIPVEEVAESSSHNVDTSNMHTFYQRHCSDYHWTKDHPLEQVHGNPSKLVQTRRQLLTDPEMCMFALTMSIAEPKNIKEC